MKYYYLANIVFNLFNHNLKKMYQINPKYLIVRAISRHYVFWIRYILRFNEGYFGLCQITRIWQFPFAAEILKSEFWIYPIKSVFRRFTKNIRIFFRKIKNQLYCILKSKYFEKLPKLFLHASRRQIWPLSGEWQSQPKHD